MISKRAGKLPQQVISKTAYGYSSYGNQIGLAAYVREYFYLGFVAKRMELGAVVGAAPKGNVVRENRAGEQQLSCRGPRLVVMVSVVRQDLLRFKQLQSVETAGAEVQKGMPSKERRSNAFSVMAMSLVSSRSPMTLEQVVCLCVAIGGGRWSQIDLNKDSENARLEWYRNCYL